MNEEKKISNQQREKEKIQKWARRKIASYFVEGKFIIFSLHIDLGEALRDEQNIIKSRLREHILGKKFREKKLFLAHAQKLNALVSILNR